MAPEVVLVGDVVQIAQDLRLGGVLLRPLPVPPPIGIEAEHVVDARHVDPGTRVPVPVPRAAEVVAAFEHAQSVSGAAQAVGEIQPRDTRAHHDDVDIRRRSVCPGCLGHHLIITPRRPAVTRTAILDLTGLRVCAEGFACALTAQNPPNPHPGRTPKAERAHSKPDRPGLTIMASLRPTSCGPRSPTTSPSRGSGRECRGRRCRLRGLGPTAREAAAA